MFGGLGVWEITLIFLVVLLLFGAKRLPEIGSSLGKGIREFKGSLKEIESELKLPEERSRATRVTGTQRRDEDGPRRLSGNEEEVVPDAEPSEPPTKTEPTAEG
jgi:sec-independent protein translocase protein TatA